MTAPGKASQTLRWWLSSLCPRCQRCTVCDCAPFVGTMSDCCTAFARCSVHLAPQWAPTCASQWPTWARGSWWGHSIGGAAGRRQWPGSSQCCPLAAAWGRCEGTANGHLPSRYPDKNNALAKCALERVPSLSATLLTCHTPGVRSKLQKLKYSTRAHACIP